MFTVLNITKRKNSIFEKLFGCFIKDEYNVRTVGVYKGAPFYELNVSVGKRKVDAQRIIDCVGKCSRRLVTNRFDLLPQNYNFGLFKSNKLYSKMIQNTFIEILEVNGLKKNPVSVCLVDRKAINTDFAQRLCEYSSTLTIVTDKTEKYNSVCEEITENTGLCPILKNNVSNENIIINLDDNTMTIHSEKGTGIIENGDDFTVPEIYNYLKPQEINKYDFYSALYELCGVFSLADCVFETISINNEKKSVADVHFS
ncbi:MAG: hypothetical protein J6B37_00980 [Clostridia bacterium]|nr:hypothetical protein [Clostridia bacterium]